MTTQNQINTTLSGQTGTAKFAGSTSPTFITPVLGVAAATTLQLNGNLIYGASGAAVASFANENSSAVNYILLESTATGVFPTIAAVGSDTNITLSLAGQGTGGAALQASTAGGNASSGFVGLLIDSIIASGSAVSLSTGTAKNLTSLSLPAGDYDVFGNLFFLVGGVCTSLNGWISLSSATQPDISLLSGLNISGGIGSSGFRVPNLRVSVSSSTNVYITALADFTTSTVTVCGGIYARLRR